MSERRLEASVAVIAQGKSQTLKMHYSCRPKAYACYGGSWYPQFDPQNRAFSIQLSNGAISLPGPMCESTYNATETWTSLEKWPVAERTVAGDKYVYSPAELKQATAEEVAGVRVVEYRVRAVR